jgi:hypothetical protein
MNDIDGKTIHMGMTDVPLYNELKPTKCINEQYI